MFYFLALVIIKTHLLNSFSDISIDVKFMPKKQSMIYFAQRSSQIINVALKNETQQKKKKNVIRVLHSKRQFYTDFLGARWPRLYWHQTVKCFH